ESVPRRRAPAQGGWGGGAGRETHSGARGLQPQEERPARERRQPAAVCPVRAVLRRTEAPHEVPPGAGERQEEPRREYRRRCSRAVHYHDSASSTSLSVSV